MKFFNTAGPINPKKHYFLPRRLDWDKVDDFLEKEYYFLLHAPRQSGKTTSILEYTQHVNAVGKYIAFYLNTEPAHVPRNDIERAQFWLLSQCDTQLSIQLPEQEAARSYLQPLLAKRPVAEDALFRFLKYWAEVSEKPLVIFIDEIDGLVEDTLVSLLKQFRTGYTNRPRHFPQSLCLIGVRNLQDYKLQSKDDVERGILLSPFNIVADALILRDFTQQQVKELYQQHTSETGQLFTEDAHEYAYYVTQGQPWLVNALAYQACFIDVVDRLQPITKEVFERAKERLILKNDTLRARYLAVMKLSDQ